MSINDALTRAASSRPYLTILHHFRSNETRPRPDLEPYHRAIGAMALALVQDTDGGSPEVTVALRKLLEFRDQLARCEIRTPVGNVTDELSAIAEMFDDADDAADDDADDSADADDADDDADADADADDADADADDADDDDADDDDDSRRGKSASARIESQRRTRPTKAPPAKAPPAASKRRVRRPG